MIRNKKHLKTPSLRTMTYSFYIEATHLVKKNLYLAEILSTLNFEDFFRSGPDYKLL